VDAQEGSWIRRSREMRWKGKEGLQHISMFSWGEKQGSQAKTYKLQADLAQSSGTSAGRAELRVWVSPCRNKAFPTDRSF
jgi:hypothetical protein